MTAPLFLVSGLVVSASFIQLRKSKYRQPIYFLPVLFMLLLSTEGINDNTSFDRTLSVSSFKDVDITSNEIQQALAQNKAFSHLPLLLSYGFPQPNIVNNQGNNIGNICSIHFSGGEGEPGTAVFKITQRTANSIQYTLVNDTSHISHWLSWKTSKVSWYQIAPGIHRVTWAIEYERLLDPAWYFSPMQEYVVKLPANALIDNLIL